ncbi:hypothetical protein H0H81_010871, partial [Sphagnurus paluster]
MKGYRFMRLSKTKIFEAATVHFLENVFPKCDDAEIPAITQYPDPFVDMGNENDQEDPSGNPEDPPSEDGDDLFIPPTQDHPEQIDCPNSPIPEREPSPDLDNYDEPQLEQQDPAPQQPAPRRNRNPTRRPGNALGDGSPTEQHKMGKRDWKKAVAEDSSK